jgi:mannose-1-phosphate guanylyltransferase
MKALILAAGKGTRLKHLTENCPKPMLPIGGIPLLEHHLRWLHRQGITELAINLHHAPELITSYFRNGRHLGVSITYSYEETLLGTAGAAKKLHDYLDQPFVVIYGDVFTDLDLARLIDFHHSQQANRGALQGVAITLALYQVPNPTECGLVELDHAGRVNRFVEKPPADQVFTRLANAGIMICEPTILDAIPAETSYDFGLDLFPKLLASGASLFGQEIAASETVIDIGTPDGYRRAQRVWELSLSSLAPALWQAPNHLDTK